METGSEAYASCSRIEMFLDMNMRMSDSDPKGMVAGGGVGVQGCGSLHRADSRLLLRVPKSSFSYRSGSQSTSTSTSASMSTSMSTSTSMFTSSSASTSSRNSVLSDINLELRRGEVVIVVGTVGSGKSSLLAAVLGELSQVLSGDNGNVYGYEDDLDDGNVNDGGHECVQIPLERQLGRRLTATSELTPLSTHTSSISNSNSNNKSSSNSSSNSKSKSERCHGAVWTAQGTRIAFCAQVSTSLVLAQY